MSLVIEMQHQAAVKKIEGLRRKRGELALDDNHAAFAMVNKEIEEAETRVRQLENAMEDRHDAARRQMKADEPRIKREQHARALAAVEELEKDRLAAVGDAEAA